MMNIVKETAPHIRRRSTVTQMMLDVVIALLPVVIFSIVVYQWHAVKVLGISIATMLLSEFVYVGLRNKMPNDGQKHSFKEKFEYAYKGHYSTANWIAPLVSALIFSMIMPANATWYSCLVGSLAGIVLGKLVFGGLGNNIFNPAAVGMVVSKICFSSSYPTIKPNWFFDVVSGGTPLTDASNSITGALNDYSILDLFIGRTGGTLGEASAVLILVGTTYLLIRRSVDFRSLFSYLFTFTGMVLVAGLVIKFGRGININYGKFVLFELLSGGLLFGVTYMITDPVTSPITSPGRIMFGMTAGVLTVFIRFFAAVPEGVAFSILIANMFAPVIDYYKWSSPRYTWKKLLVMGLLFAVPVAILVIVISFTKLGGAWYVK